MPGSNVSILTTAQTTAINLWVCGECGALCRPDEGWKHEQWHNTLVDSMLANLSDIRTAPMPSLAEVRRQIDGLYILLGENPPFNESEPARAAGT